MKNNFSVIIPLYNKQASIKRTICSVLNQIYTNFEIVIVDDGSTDDSLSVVQSINSCAIRVISKMNEGVSEARNCGLRNAKHRFCALLDADDEWANNHLSEINNLIEMNPSSGIYSTSYNLFDGKYLRKPRVSGRINLNGNILINFFETFATGDPPFFTSSVCIDRDKALGINGFKYGVKHGEDIDLWARMALNYSIAFNNIATVTYNLAAENRSSHSFPSLENWCFHGEESSNLYIKDDKKYIKKLIDRVNGYQIKPNLFHSDKTRVIKHILTAELSLYSRLFFVSFALLPTSLKKYIRIWVQNNQS